MDPRRSVSPNYDMALPIPTTLLWGVSKAGSQGGHSRCPGETDCPFFRALQTCKQGMKACKWWRCCFAGIYICLRKKPRGKIGNVRKRSGADYQDTKRKTRHRNLITALCSSSMDVSRKRRADTISLARHFHDSLPFHGNVCPANICVASFLFSPLRSWRALQMLPPAPARSP